MRELLEDAKMETDALRKKVWPERIMFEKSKDYIASHLWREIFLKMMLF